MKSGFVTLVLAIIISAVGTAIAINSLIITDQNNKNNIVKEDSLKSQKIAESCLELVFDKLIQNKFYSGDETLTIEGEECRVYSIYKRSNKHIIQIEAGAQNYKKYLEAEINQLAPNLKIKYTKNITNLSDGDINTSAFNSNNPYKIKNANLKLWLKADGININNNIGFSTWSDYSSGQITPISFEQSDETKRPKFIEYNDNFLPTVKFDGVDDFMSAGAENLFDNTNGMSIFIVGKSNKVDINQSYISKFSQPDNKMEWRFQNDNFAIASLNGTINPTDITNLTSETNYRLFSGIWIPNNPIETYINSSTSPISNNATSSINSINITDTDLLIGAIENGNAGFLDGEISEIIVYNTALDNTERQRVEQYLNTKYEIY